jgi:hypothetical protein
MIDRKYKGQDIYILGSGHSLKGFDLSKLDGKNVIAINHSIEFYPKAQSLIFGDKIFLVKTTFDLKKYKGDIFTSSKNLTHKLLQEMKDQPNVHIFDDRRKEVSESFQHGLYHPTSTGLLAINLALVMGAKTIYLLGYDYTYDNGIIHYYDYDEKKYEHHYTYSEDRMQGKVTKFRGFQKSANKIINLNPDSFLNIFEKATLESVFG